jgi:hypothetical protein
MERPKVTVESRKREVTGELVYLNEMKRANQSPAAYDSLSDMAIQLYETEAEIHQQYGTQPEIITLLEQYDEQLSDTEVSCVALADELLALKDEKDKAWSFVDIVIDQAPDQLLAKIKATRIGQVLADDNEQLAMPSDGSYYPVLDVTKATSKLVGVGLCVWGWDYEKYVFTNEDDEKYEHPKHVLVYPAEEKKISRQLELQFSYRTADGGGLCESVSLCAGDGAHAGIVRSVWMSAYAETGYEGHNHARLEQCTDEDMGAFGDIIAEAVGDVPESVVMRQLRLLQELVDKLPADGREVVQRLIDTTWPAQAIYLLGRRLKDTNLTVAKGLRDETYKARAIAMLEEAIGQWSQRRQTS